MTAYKGFDISDNAKIIELVDAFIRLQREISYITSQLDSENVRRLNTDYTEIKSNDGTTQIDGPVLIQKDGSGTVRLRQGYNSSTGQFQYALYNVSGAQTIGIDSNGNGTFTGTITVTRSDNKARVLINATDGIKLQKGDGVGNWTDVVYLDSNGDANFTGIVTGGTVRTAVTNKRVEISQNQIRTYNDSNNLNGLVTDNSTGQQFGDWIFYINGNKAFTVYNGVDHVTLLPEPTYPLIIGSSGRNTYLDGNISVSGNFNIANPKTPLSATDTGSTGDMCWDSDYIYVCTATNTWKRAALTTW